MKRDFFCVAFIFLGLPLLVFAHPGRTDSVGCHTCRTNCPSWGLSTGEYHCHNAKALPQPEEPIRSHYGEGGTGYTEPWPEYKAPESIQIPIAVPVVSVPVVEDPPAEPVVEEAIVVPEVSIPVQEVARPAPRTNWLIRLFRFLF